MALEPCRECDHEVSTEAETCPNCGTPNPTGQPVHATGAAASPYRVRWWVVVGAVLAVVLAVPLVTYGTVSPCEMLRKEVMRTAAAEASGAGDGWEMIGVALGGQMVESLVGAMSPLECLTALPEARSGRLDLTGRSSGQGRSTSPNSEAAYFTTLRADLINLRSAQEMHYQTDGDFSYADNLAVLDLPTDPRTDIHLDPASDAFAWAATATHSGLGPDVGCAIIYGDVASSAVDYPVTPGGRRLSSVLEGSPVCDD